LAFTTHFFADVVVGEPSSLLAVAAWSLPALLTLFFLAAIASVVAVCVAILRTDMREQTFKLPGITIIVRPYNFALLPAALTTLAMGRMLVGTLAWGLIARATLPDAFDTAPAFDGLTNALTWTAIVAVMALTTAVAGAAVLQGFAGRAGR